MNFFNDLETSDARVIESQGNTILGIDKDGHAVAQNRGESEYKYIKDEDGNKLKVKSGNYTLSSAERTDSKNFVALTGKSGQIKTWRMNKNWRLKKDLGKTKPDSDKYFEEELKFNQSFGEALTNEYDQNNPLSNFWSSEPEAGRLWGFYNFGQYTGAQKGSDAKVFETFSRWSYPSTGIPSNTKGKDIIAVLDTGVNYNHEELNSNMYINKGETYGNGVDDDKNGYVDDYIGYDMSSNNSLPWDTQGHGTHVSGTIGASANNRGVIGANPTAKILGVKVLGPQGGTTSDIIEGFNYALMRGAKVINLSLGGGSYSSAFKKAIDTAGKKYKAITVAAAGNNYTDNDKNPFYPASYPSKFLVSVASSGLDDDHSDFSNWGKKSVDIYAPGESIYSPWAGGESSYKYTQGTSMAAPLVSGIISSYWSRNPSKSPKKVINQLLKTVDDIGYSKYNKTGGRVNMARMMGYAKSAETKSSPLEQKTISTSSNDKITGKPNTALQELIAKSKSELKSLKITDSVIIDFKGSSGLSEKNINRLSSKLTTGKLQAHDINLEILQSFDNDLAILDFGENMSQKLKVRLCAWLMNNNLIESVEMDSLHQPV